MPRLTASIFSGAIASLFLLATAGTTIARQESGEPGKTPVISAINEQLRPFLEHQEIAGAVTLVATSDRIVHSDAIGNADIGEAKPMRPDSIVWIASMTKPITGTAVLMLHEEGKLSVDDLVETYIPEFQSLKMADGKPARVTIRHLLTHTSGMSDLSPGEARGIKKLAGVIPLYVAKPVRFEPGTKWAYCQSAINTAARIVEVVSGEPFEEFLQRRLFDPLEMKDTTFYLTDNQLPRLASSYRRSESGKLEATEIRFLNGQKPDQPRSLPGGERRALFDRAGLRAFCQMILNEGEFDGRRYLKPESVRLMTTVQSGDLKTGFTPGNGWGLGWCVVREPQGVTATLSPGTFGHGGAYGTQAWIDPVKKRVYILMVQRANFANSDLSEVRRAFQEAANSALGRAK